IFNAFRHLFPFSPRQGGRSALAFGSKRKNLLGRHLNLLLNKPIIQVSSLFLVIVNPFSNPFKIMLSLHVIFSHLET
ncbi:MAG TPA: hypothetical protein VLG67_00370, partial [Candidatus Saccharimonadales bacterium]|nr:hypothetical protein [Candidatus Saccharimonadales bacterium]